MTPTRTFARPHRLAGALAAAVALAAAGCGGYYPVEGKVTFPDGSPAAGCQVIFELKDHAGRSVSARGDVGEDGTFCMGTDKPGDGVPEGVHRVLVAPPPEPENESEAARPRAIDDKFTRFETSELEHTVTRDRAKNYLAITVTKPAPAGRKK